jgi:hypothetical protein
LAQFNNEKERISEGECVFLFVYFIVEMIENRLLSFILIQFLQLGQGFFLGSLQKGKQQLGIHAIA